MLHTRLKVARDIASPLLALERTVDTAITEASAVSVAMATGRTEAKVSAIMGQEAFDAMGKVHAALASLRRYVVDAHLALDATRELVRLPTTSFGDESEKPPKTGVEAAAPLRAVA